MASLQEKKRIKTAVIDVGGGTRGIYGAGFFDYCMDNDIVFDHCIGVSAGSANLVSYMAGQRRRNFQFYNEYAFRKEYMSLHNYLKTRSYIDLDYIYSTLSDEHGENPVNYEAFMAHPANLEIVATNALTGKPVYFQKKDIRKNHYEFLKASCCVPVVNRPYPVGRGLFFDGGASDPIPLRRAFESGCDRVVLVLTRPKNYHRKGGKDRPFAAALKKKYPQMARAMARRAAVYNHYLDIALRLEKKGRVIIVAPDSIGGLKTLSQDHQALEALYEKGYRDASVLERIMGTTR
ncbi:MAG: patatin family protein [Lachnospiraceae bacterium]|nr:patatin family protein [Lachnospiraceae bacterium]